MNFRTEATPNFRKELKPLIKKYPSLKMELEQLESELQKNPWFGIPLGNNCYKIKLGIASKNRGKSGGARIITYVKVKNEIVYLVSIYDKSDQDDIDENDLLNIVKEIPL